MSQVINHPAHLLTNPLNSTAKITLLLRMANKSLVVFSLYRKKIIAYQNRF